MSHPKDIVTHTTRFSFLSEGRKDTLIPFATQGKGLTSTLLAAFFFHFSLLLLLLFSIFFTQYLDEKSIHQG